MAEPERPAEELSSGDVTLRRWRADDADLACRLVTGTIEHLRPFMPWAQRRAAPPFASSAAGEPGASRTPIIAAPPPAPQTD